MSDTKYVDNAISYYTEIVDLLVKEKQSLKKEEHVDNIILPFIIGGISHYLISIREIVKVSQQSLDYSPKVREDIEKMIKDEVPQAFILKEDKLYVNNGEMLFEDFKKLLVEGFKQSNDKKQ